MIWFIYNKERTRFRANDNQGERQLERTDTIKQVDRMNEVVTHDYTE